MRRATLVQVSGSHEQAGEVLQLPGGELVQGAGDVGLGCMAQQDDDQVAVPAVAVVQPHAAALGCLLVGELARVGHQGSPPAAAGGAGEAQPRAAQDTRPAAWLVAQLVGGILQARANQPLTHDSPAALATTGPWE